MCLTILKKRKETDEVRLMASPAYRFPGLKLRQQKPKQTINSSELKRMGSKFRECRYLHFWTENQQWESGSGVCACVLRHCSCVRLCYSVDCGGADPLWTVACLCSLPKNSVLFIQF